MRQEWEEGKQTGFDFNITLDDGNHVLEYLGSQKCCDGTTHWTFKYNNSNWMEFTTTNLNKLATTEIFHDWSDKHTIQPFPMEYANIMAKTLPWDRDPIERFSELETAMFLDAPPDGFCERPVQDMSQVSNQFLCKSDIVNNIGHDLSQKMSSTISQAVI